MISYAEVLDSTAIQPEIANIFANIPAARIEVNPEELKELLQREGLAPVTDGAALCDLLAHVKAKKIITNVLVGLCELHGLEFNRHKLGNLSPDDRLRLLFAIFQIGPEPVGARVEEPAQQQSEPEPETEEQQEPVTGEAAPTPPPSDARQDVALWLEQLLPDGLKELLELPEEVWSGLCGGRFPSREIFDSLSSSQSRNLLERALLGVDAVYESSILKMLPGNMVFEIFQNIFALPEKPVPQAPPSQPEPIVSGAAEHKLSRERAQQIYDNAAREMAERLIDVSKLEVYQDLPITILDNLDMTVSPGLDLYYGCVLLVNPATGRVAGLGHIEIGLKRNSDHEYSPHLIFAAEDLDYEVFLHQNRFNLVLFPADSEKTLHSRETYTGKALIVPVGAEYHDVPESDTVLCIDFGTSNTTAGTFGVAGETDRAPTLVRFQDVTQNKPALSHLLPTMVYVQSCGGGLPPVYKFGFEAKKELIDHDYIPTASCLFEIKRWLTSLGNVEPLEDEQGGSDKNVLRKDIIFAYLQYVITAAEAQFKKRFKKLHFTAPVKQKSAFLGSLEDMFAHTDKNIISYGESLDEGIAVVYHYIKKALQPPMDRGAEDLDVFIVDCGGGTTDLASCHCEYERSEIFDSLRLKPGYVNGDSNFGGNNITYRVLQMLKIKIASKLLNQESIDMQKLVDLDEDGILLKIDSGDDQNVSGGAELAKQEIYKKFQEAYDAAEAIIPTRFNDYQHQREKEQVRRNFYYLWKIAEAIKIEFYKAKSNLVNLDQEDPRIYAGDMENYYLMVRLSGGTFTRLGSPMHEIPVTFKEVERILCPDIYSLLRLLLGKERPGGKALTEYRYRLSGQSCKIDLFHNLLKEFIPGKYLRKGQSVGESVESTGSESLKEYCIRGSIEFVSDKHFGDLELIFEEPDIRHVYTVKFMQGETAKTILAPGPADNPEQPELAVITRPVKTREAILKVYDSSHIETNKISYAINEEVYAMTMDEILLYFKDLCALEDTDYLRRQIFSKVQDLAMQNKGDFICLFALPAKKIYGFNLCQITIRRKDGEPKYGIPRHTAVYPYENEDLVTFFDGNR